MRTFRHWTPRYVISRARDKLYSVSHPNMPWLTPQANAILSTMLRASDRGMEFGSGRSTLWLARGVGHLTSVEHNRDWYRSVSQRLEADGIQNVDYLFVAPDTSPQLATQSEYARTVLRFAEAALDFVLVDGIFRDACVKLSLDKLRPGGLLILDNVNRYLPSNSRSPGSRTPSLGPASAVWSDIARTLEPWRRIWTSSGIADTAIFVKPPAAPGFAADQDDHEVEPGGGPTRAAGTVAGGSGTDRGWSSTGR